ncbi:MAG: nickel insertion protein [Phycisphaeraceae bacterium]|nr:nickel insertion protein [Phycisphaeraceae bacterium]
MEIQINLDDVSGELVGAVVQRQLEEGALDAWVVPIQMKKNRPGMMLCVLCDQASAPGRARDLLAQTGSFGARFRSWDRLVLDRRHEEVQTEWGPLRLKVGGLEGKDLVAKAEFDDVLELAESAGRPLAEVLSRAQRLADQYLQNPGERPR